jgi:HSP20 family protein
MSRMRTAWNPWREMNRLRQELDQLAGRGEWWPNLRQTTPFPAINALESEKGLTLTAELPGIDASQLDVHVDKDSITIAGHRATAPTTPKDESYVRRERWFEPFRRTVELPFDVDPDKCEAVYEKGVLTLKLERRPEHEPKKLSIKAG